jgi:carbohydrate-selective porin OprB
MKQRLILCVLILFGITEICRAEDEKRNVWECETLTDGFWGLDNKLKDKGIEASLGITNIYQQNVRGGISTHRRAGRFAGSYDLEMEADLQKLLGIEGGRLYSLTEGSWSKAGGIDTPSVGSFFGVNGDAIPREAMQVSEFWYEQTFADETVRLRIGRLDLTGGFEHHNCPVSFDCSSYANDETSQFLNSALINNPTIPFPDRGLGTAVYYTPAQLLYFSAAAADAQADARETGFRTTFGGEDYFFYIFEAGITPEFNSANGPLQGAYRAGLWNDPQPKANADSTKSYRDDTGFYTTCDQMLFKENNNPEDGQGLGAFFRYGWADSKRNDLNNFWSAGFQYQGLFDRHDDDVLGLGFAQGFFSDKAQSTYTEDYESVIETYYNAALTNWLNLTPGLQYVTNTGGDKNNNDTVIFSLRLQMVF